MLSKLCGYSGLTYWYNGRNQIIKAASNGITVGVYTYNADGIRTAKQTVNGTTYFLLDGGYVIGEASPTAVETTYFIIQGDEEPGYPNTAARKNCAAVNKEQIIPYSAP